MNTVCGLYQPSLQRRQDESNDLLFDTDDGRTSVTANDFRRLFEAFPRFRFCSKARYDGAIQSKQRRCLRPLSAGTACACVDEHRARRIWCRLCHEEISQTIIRSGWLSPSLHCQVTALSPSCTSITRKGTIPRALRTGMRRAESLEAQQGISTSPVQFIGVRSELITSPRDLYLPARQYGRLHTRIRRARL